MTKGMIFMTSRERVKCIILCKGFDRIPYSFDLTSHVTDMIASHYCIVPREVHAFIGDDLIYIGHGNPTGVEDRKCEDDTFYDEFGVLWNGKNTLKNIGDWGELRDFPLKDATLIGYSFPDGSAPGRFMHIDGAVVHATDRYVVLGITGLFDMCWHFRGFENFLADLAFEDAFVHELLDASAQYIADVIGCAPDYIDGVRFTEDWGLQHGLMMNPALWRRMLKPRLKIMYDAARKRGFNVLIHSCGDIAELFPDLIEIGVEVINPIQPEAMNVEWLKKEYGNYVTLYGGIGCQSTLPFGSPADVIKEAKSRLQVLGKGGGYIFGPAGAISTDAKPENVVALVEFCMNEYK